MNKPFVRFKLCWPFLARDEFWDETNFSIRPQGLSATSLVEFRAKAGTLPHPLIGKDAGWWPIIARYRAPETQITGEPSCS